MNYTSPERMNLESTRIFPRLRLESKSLRPRTALPKKPTAELEQLKQRLMKQELAEVVNKQEKAWLHRAADEAASVAWSTAHPLLVLPVLLEEKTCRARAQFQLQMQIASRSQNKPTLTERNHPGFVELERNIALRTD
jgi:hypothetical protein